MGYVGIFDSLGKDLIHEMLSSRRQQVSMYVGIWLYLDAEVLVLPPVFYPQDSCFVGLRLFVVNQLPPTRSQFRLLCWCGLSMRGVSVIPRAVSLRVSVSQSTGILGIPLPALLSNMHEPGAPFRDQIYCS